MNARPVMIFHVAYSLNPNALSASGLRPVRMRRAFEAAGFEVLEVSGRHNERREQIRELCRRIKSGLRVDYVYSESATSPTGLGEPVTLATSRTRDISFLRFCQRSGIPVGLFYRDIYWRFPIFAEVVRWPLAPILRALHRFDLIRYRRAGLTIFLPSLEMARWVPIIPRDRIRELPPGGELRDAETGRPNSMTRLLYVGGLGDNYRLHETVREVANRDDVLLTICTREAEWLVREVEYRQLLGANVEIVHAGGGQLEALYAKADVCVLAVEPIPYWEFAVPMKLLEYVGYGKPVIASEGSYSGRFVREQGVGWAIQYGSGELPALLDRLRDKPMLIDRVAERVRGVRLEHTWESRARQVARELTVIA